jgi:Zn finger protein HypA/HybF involved in hydrogenase expression
MHELSIAQAILELAAAHVPTGARLCAVRVSAGPMRGIDPQCLQAAFNALNPDNPQQAVRLDLLELPWPMRCDDCGRSWTTDQLDSHCTCGSTRVRPTGGDDLELLSIEIDTPVLQRSAS